jgi:hypothetical protein
LIRHCARAGCLLAHAFEHLVYGDNLTNNSGSSISNPCEDDVGSVPEFGRNKTDVDEKHLQGSCCCGLARYAAMGVDFLLLRHHFNRWAAAASSGAFQV